MIRFVPLSAVLTIHAELLREFGGKSGMRDRSLLESALARPKHLHLYEKADLFRLAAAYAFGVIKNHPFIDGNKRTGLVVACG
ncbi:MAG: type II toxin-antitoxin system death-on-curing family toxin, partial [Deltaproteobacteria bacterium]|nr:type II toxin-antitoxin system death-on-curing family toxin [Deltaproteobacteria bacterium]